MGMGWKFVDYSYKTSRRKCKCGKGEIIVTHHVTQESEMMPFERGEDITESTCPSNCEQNNGRKECFQVAQEVE